MLDAKIFQLVMDHDPNMVFIKDQDSVIRYANKTFFDVHPPEQRDKIIGYTRTEDFPKEEVDLFLAEDRRAIEIGFTEIVEEITDYSGRVRVFLTRKTRFYNENNVPFLLGISTDVTELYQREKSLVEANEQLKRFTALAAHDLRSPINSIISVLEMVRHDNQSQLSPHAAKLVEMAIASSNGLTENISSLLSITRAENTGELGFEIYNLNILIEEVRFNLSGLMQDTGTSVYSTRLPSIPVNPQLFRQLFQNLIENSIKHKGFETPQIIIRYEELPDQHVFLVEDNGRGIAPEKAEALFNLFERGDSAADGTGIGLSLCQRIVRLHHGQIAFDTSYQNGCRVRIMLPK